VSPGEVRAQLLKQLIRVAERLPNGLLQRLVSDAQFFSDWNMGKKKARASARVSQFHAWQEKAEEKRWKEINLQRHQEP
jgi:hypothetical protein